jgi:hypothetical protein
MTPGQHAKTLAPTAKFRSDGEISVSDCAAAGSPAQANVVMRSRVPRPTDSRRNSAARLSAEVQCWPWSPACVNASQLQDGAGTRPGETRRDRQDQKDQDKSGLARNASSARSNFALNRSNSLTVFQRLGGLTRSLSFRSSNKQLELPTQPQSSCDEDWIFFRGFSGKRKEELESRVGSYTLLTVTGDEGTDSRTVTAPPRMRRRPRRALDSDDGARRQSLRRSLSLTDAHFIAQAIYEGDMKLITELYPEFAVGSRSNSRDIPVAHYRPPLADQRDCFSNEACDSSGGTGRCGRADRLAPAACTLAAADRAGSAPVSSSKYRKSPVAAVATAAAAAAGAAPPIEDAHSSVDERRQRTEPQHSSSCLGHAGAGQRVAPRGGNAQDRLSQRNERRLEDNNVTFSTSIMFVKQADQEHYNHRFGKIGWFS